MAALGVVEIGYYPPDIRRISAVVADGSGGHEACVLVPQGHPKLARNGDQADHQLPLLEIALVVRCGVDEVTPGLGPAARSARSVGGSCDVRPALPELRHEGIHLGTARATAFLDD